MRRRLALAVLALVLVGCASGGLALDGAAALLARADGLADRQQYEPALRAYDEFLSRYPGDPAAPRALKSRDAIVTARAELARLRSELAARDAELAAREAELVKLRQLTERLRADLEKLKEVDLNLERKKR
jgi:ubiquinone biosynthesis protein UbiJ